jgi:hypothetical protein
MSRVPEKAAAPASGAGNQASGVAGSSICCGSGVNSQRGRLFYFGRLVNKRGRRRLINKFGRASENKGQTTKKETTNSGGRNATHWTVFPGIRSAVCFSAQLKCGDSIIFHGAAANRLFKALMCLVARRSCF